MGPYSHYHLAARLEPTLRPEHPGAYSWGSVAPDVRYLANLRRETTHLPPEQVRELIQCYPHLRSFLTGWLVHVLIDQVDVGRVVGAAFPLNLINKARRKPFSPPQMTMLVEMHYLQSTPAGQPLSGEHNEVLAGMGITAEQARVFHRGLQEYFDARSFDAALSAFQKIGMIQNKRAEKYLRAYRAMQQRKWMNTLILLSMKNAKLDTRVIAHVQSSI